MLHGPLHGRIQAVYTIVYMTVYTVRTRGVQGRAHGRVYTTRPCRRAMSIAVNMHDRVDSGIHGRLRAVDTAHAHGRVHRRVFDRTRAVNTTGRVTQPCTRPSV